MARNGAIYYGERFTGEIRILAPTTASDALFFAVPDVASQPPEHGLLGLALHPDYPTTPYVYAFVTRLVSGAVRIQIVRIKNSGGRGTKMKVCSAYVADVHHNGGRLLFGPDRRLDDPKSRGLWASDNGPECSDFTGIYRLALS